MSVQFVAFQGDCMVIGVNAIPEGVQEVAPDDGVFILAHSETGHHHVVEHRSNVRLFRDTSQSLTAWLEIGPAPGTRVGAILEHLRSFDTHVPIQLPPGKYRVRNAREYSPLGFRRVQD